MDPGAQPIQAKFHPWPWLVLSVKEKMAAFLPVIFYVCRFLFCCVGRVRAVSDGRFCLVYLTFVPFAHNTIFYVSLSIRTLSQLCTIMPASTVGKRKTFAPLNIPCSFHGCRGFFKNSSGLTQHKNSSYVQFNRPREPFSVPNFDTPAPLSPGSHASSVAGGEDAAPSILDPPPLCYRYNIIPL
jgi:hypothetical protein